MKAQPSMLFVMPGHSRPKDGVLSHAYVPGIHVFGKVQESKTWMAGTSPAMTAEGTARCASLQAFNDSDIAHGAVAERA